VDNVSLPAAIKLVLIDDDSVFRLGLRLWLNQFADLEVVYEADSGTTALEWLENQTNNSASESSNALSDDSLLAGMVDLVILNVSLGQTNPSQLQGLTLCQDLKARYPQLPVLLLSSLTEPVMQAAAQQIGADGFCPRDVDVTLLLQGIHQVAQGETFWSLTGPEPDLATRAAMKPDLGAVPQAAVTGPFAIARRHLRQSGIRQIEATLAAIHSQLQAPDLPVLDRAILAGQRRELRAARWLIQRLLATPTADRLPAISPAPAAPTPSPAPPYPDQRLLASTSVEQDIQDKQIQMILFDSMLKKLPVDVINQTKQPLEIDILREDKKRELCYLILRKLEDLLNELRYSQLQPEQLLEKRSLILLDLWQIVATDFFGKYYTVTLVNQDIEVVNVILQDGAIVQAEILDKIPFVTDLLAHLLFRFPLSVDSNFYVVGNPEAINRAEALLDNLVIQMANAVIQPLLNRFSNIESIKQNFYHHRLLSNREIERFRNSLSWKYRIEKYVNEPKDIFESQYRLLVFYSRGIKQTAIYAPRITELEQLSGIQFAVTLALETRDAIAPRLRAAFSVAGRGFVYVLTEVIGRGLGLIGRGILQGIGGAWQDHKSNRN
jgi:DNA-binding NarL/FixJ family response regulator